MKLGNLSGIFFLKKRLKVQDLGFGVYRSLGFRMVRGWFLRDSWGN